MTKSKGIKRPDWHWTKRQLALLRARHLLATQAQLAELIGCTVGQVAGVLQKLNLHKPKGSMLVGRPLSTGHKRAIRDSMLLAVKEGRTKPPTAEVIGIGLAAANLPAAVAKRTERAAATMRGRPQRMECVTAAAEHNWHAKTYTVVSPDQQRYTFTNLEHFVRTHAHLFGQDDARWKKTNSKRWCRASIGLHSIFRNIRPAQQWKGWRAHAKSESNAVLIGADILPTSHG